MTSEGVSAAGQEGEVAAGGLGGGEEEAAVSRAEESFILGIKVSGSLGGLLRQGGHRPAEENSHRHQAGQSLSLD